MIKDKIKIVKKCRNTPKILAQDNFVLIKNATNLSNPYFIF